MNLSFDIILFMRKFSKIDQLIPVLTFFFLFTSAKDILGNLFNIPLSVFFSEKNNVLKQLTVQIHCIRRIVVSGDGIGYECRVTVGIHNPYRRDHHIGTFGYGHMFFTEIVLCVNEYYHVRQPRHFTEMEVHVCKQTASPETTVGIFATSLSGLLHEGHVLRIPGDKKHHASSVYHVGHKVQGMAQAR